LETAYRQNNPDYLLYAAVNRSLDLMIAKLGRQRIEEGVRQLRRMQSLAEERCLKEAIFPCSSEGKWQKKTLKTAMRMTWAVDTAVSIRFWTSPTSRRGRDCNSRANTI
jgi:hypothetical protein